MPRKTPTKEELLADAREILRDLISLESHLDRLSVVKCDSVACAAGQAWEASEKMRTSIAYLEGLIK